MSISPRMTRDEKQDQWQQLIANNIKTLNELMLFAAQDGFTTHLGVQRQAYGHTDPPTRSSPLPETVRYIPAYFRKLDATIEDVL